MVGEGVLHECLNSAEVEAVLIINRKTLGLTHPKLTEVIHPDLYDVTPIRLLLQGYNACFFCLGVSSVGMKEPEYTRVTYDLTLHVADVLAEYNPNMAFCYISGAGTDSTEKGSSMWARVKGKTENDLMKLPFKQVYAFRPGFIKPIKGLTKTHAFYKYINWMFPIGRKVFPSGFCTMQELAAAMMQVVNHPFDKKVVEGKDIIALAHQRGM